MSYDDMVQIGGSLKRQCLKVEGWKGWRLAGAAGV